MSLEITKAQKQALGSALEQAGYVPAEFVYSELKLQDNVTDAARLTNRETSEKFTFYPYNREYKVRYDIPGTSRVFESTQLDWDDVLRRLTTWAIRVSKENEAVDPWAQEAEDMANDDSHFTVAELPKVDHAIDESIEELKSLALENGKKLAEIEGELQTVKTILKKTARQTTKKEWISLFKGIIIEKIIDWGMKAELFQIILHTLITSVQDVAQLAERASQYLL